MTVVRTLFCHFSVAPVLEQAKEKLSFYCGLFDYLSWLFPEGNQKTRQNLRYESLHPGRESSQATFEGKSTALPFEQPARRTLMLPTVQRFSKETNNGLSVSLVLIQREAGYSQACTSLTGQTLIIMNTESTPLNMK